MERLRQELDSLLCAQFPGGDVALEIARPAAKVGGVLAWGGFDGLEPLDRQRRVSAVIGSHFGPEDRAHISAVIALSPAEYAVYKREQATDREPLAA